MIINVANFNFGGDGGGGGKPALLQEKTATIVQNGSQTITPDEGFDGMSSVQINAAITGDSSAIDFSSIGYDAELSAEVNAKLNDDVAYSKTLYDKWNPSNTSAYRLYRDDKKLVYAPNIDTRNVTSMGFMFSDCSSLKTVPFYNTSKVNNMSLMFSNCISLKTIPSFDTRNVNDMRSMFSNCKSLEVIPELDTSVCTDFDSMFWNLYSIKRIEGINFRAATDSSYSNYYFMFNTSRDSNIRYLLIKEIGTQSGCTKIPAIVLDVWGVNTDEIPDARQSLIDSLITYSFDRASAGYPTCTITLSDNTKALLTEDEISQINAKGFVIA